ncbi:MAG TPA: transcription elongation factor GreA, partial [Spirochaetaceae bacterium]|nr:transcription elongation factor GreA [Spirochaetaceae bacterium]
NWPDIYIQLLPYARSNKMLEALENADQEEKLKRLAMYIVENYKDMREAFIWLAKDLKDKPWLKELGIVREKIILTLLHILDITFKEIDSHKDTTENRKINKLVQNILFKEKDLEEFLEDAPQQVTERVYSMLADIKEVDPAIKLNIKKKIGERFPDIK